MASNESYHYTENRIELLRKSIGRGARKRVAVADELVKVPDTKIQRIFQANPQLLEDFFVIGISQEDIAALRKQHTDPPKDMYRTAKLLFTHSGNTNCQRRKVVKDFCFPSPVSRQIHLE